ncbi:alpha/beta hydrolase [Vibrio parahaemolyticus]|uniref:alpha/beta hydrolase n=1 Tax=Vibrio parahaemolyticus TaxID=670 RepID=UPI00111D73CA|nr:alpha/beta hydrolase [Vibrio parahaemolyticus]TOF35830.1 alpha/beta hydrolase [Vibrio parahaemolyticus]
MNTQKVTFRNADMAWDIAALILLPEGFDESKRYPTMISVHPFGSCKEQTSSAVYGKALAELGYVVIAFDASFQGESGGLPRYVEDPSQRVEDISRVIDYAVTLPYVDETRIGGLGICGGGAYVISAALTEKRLKAVVGITPVNVGRLFREGFSLYNPNGTLEAMAAQRTAEARGGELQVNELLPPSLEFAKENGLTERDGQEVYGRAVASKDRQLVDLENWSHYELYDHPQAVGMAMEKVSPFLDKHLK